MFIVIEGLDGSGKSTAGKQLAEKLHSRLHKKVQLTHEPNKDYCGGDYIRAVLAKKITEFHPRVLPLSFAANRLDHCARLVQPCLDAGQMVISDRYYLSSLVYQSSEDFPFEKVMEVNEKALKPDLIFFLNVSNEVCYERMSIRNEPEELFESRLDDYRKKYISAIEFLRTVHGDYIVEIDGNGTVAETVGQMVEVVESMLQ